MCGDVSVCRHPRNLAVDARDDGVLDDPGILEAGGEGLQAEMRLRHRGLRIVEHDP